MKGRVSPVISACLCLAFAGLLEANYLSCDRARFHKHVHSACTPVFKQAMARSGYQRACPWPTTKIYYYNLTKCVEEKANLTKCVEPALRDEIFLEIHKTYFSLCSRLQDPALHIQLLFILPCIITTLLLPFLCTHITTME